MVISTRIKDIPLSPTMQVNAKAKEMMAEGIDVIDFSVGEPDFPTPENIKLAGIKAIENNKTKYTMNQGTLELRKAICYRLKNDYGIEYSVNEIIVSSGAKQGIFNAVQSLVNNDDEVIIIAPYWVSYPAMVTVAGGRSVILNTDEKSGFKINPEALKNAVNKKTKVMLLCTPSNPSGSVYRKEELLSIGKIAVENDMYIIADEIYSKLVYDGKPFTSLASLNEEIKNKTILINGVSKAYAMTGWRIGYSAGPEEIIKAMNKLQSHSTSNASSVSQAAAVEAFLGDQNAVQNMIKEFEGRRNFLYESINSIKDLSANKPEGAFYILANIRSFLGRSAGNIVIKDSYSMSMYLLNEAKVATVPGSAFGAENYIRISFATGIENLKKGMQRINAALLYLK